MNRQEKLHEILSGHWGFDQFRPLQEDIINAVLDGRDTLALLPTGGGKSLCYQIPALYLDGISIVVSPLIALMKDQVEALQRRNILAEAIYSGMDYRTIDRILDNCIYGKVKVLYVSPERLQTDMAEARIRKMPVSLLAVDEAHCISQWGYDFRPAYLEIARLREWHPQVPLLALTATATHAVQDDILKQLKMQEPALFSQSFRRENLRFAVKMSDNKLETMLRILKNVKGPGIVYVRNRKKTRSIATILQQNGIDADAYHAGMPAAERMEIQESWIRSNKKVIVCTNAFGMGIDKPDVRIVLHYDIPSSLEEYYQEAGRAGRNGRLAGCMLLYDPGDKEQALKQFEQSYPPLDVIRNVYKAINNFYQRAPGYGKGESYDFDFREFCTHFRLEMLTTHHALGILEKEGWISLSEAVWSPSRAVMLVNKEDLYQYQLSNPAEDLILKAMLRNYEGLFVDPVRINEKQLAGLLEIQQEVLIASLNKLARQGIIEYTPAKDKAQISFLNDRVELKNFSIDKKAYAWRKKMAGDRLKSVLDYLTTPHCRISFILHYFGEKKADACGNCDRCRKPEQAGLSSHWKRFLSNIPEEGISLKSLMLEFGSDEERPILKSLKYLEEEGFISVKRDIVFRSKTVLPS